MLEGISIERVNNMSDQEKRWFDNIKKAFHESDIAIVQKHPENRCIEELCKAIDTSKTLRRSLLGQDVSYCNNKARFIEFLDFELPSPKDGGLCVTLENSKTGKSKEYSFSELIYDIRCMVHENENLNVAEETDYHILIDWTIRNECLFGEISDGKVICNGYLVLNRLREILSKFITGIESMLSIFKTGKFQMTIRPEIGTIKPKSKK